MRKWHAPQVAAAIVIGLAIAGCEPSPRGSDDPMATTGPNQVVIKVPGMT